MVFQGFCLQVCGFYLEGQVKLQRRLDKERKEVFEWLVGDENPCLQKFVPCPGTRSKIYICASAPHAAP